MRSRAATGEDRRIHCRGRRLCEVAQPPRVWRPRLSATPDNARPLPSGGPSLRLLQGWVPLLHLSQEVVPLAPTQTRALNGLARLQPCPSSESPVEAGLAPPGVNPATLCSDP